MRSSPLLRRWLRPGGTLVLTTPDAAALDAGHRRRRADRHPGARGAPDPVQPGVARRWRCAAPGSGTCRSRRRTTAWSPTPPTGRSGFRADAAERHCAGLQALSRAPRRNAPSPARRCGTARRGGCSTLLAGRRRPAGRCTRCSPASPRPGASGSASTWPGCGCRRCCRRRAFAGPDRVRRRRWPRGSRSTWPACCSTARVLERRTPGRTPEQVLAFARPAYLHAVQTRRVLQADDMIDLDLKRTAWRARMLIVDCLAELAPEVEARAAARPGRRPRRARCTTGSTRRPEAVAARIVPAFIALVQADRFDEAAGLEPWMRDLDAVCAVCAEERSACCGRCSRSACSGWCTESDPLAALAGIRADGDGGAAAARRSRARRGGAAFPRRRAGACAARGRSAWEADLMDPNGLDFDADRMLRGLRPWVECESPTWDAAAVGPHARPGRGRPRRAWARRSSACPGTDGLRRLRAAPPAASAPGPGILVMGHLDTVHPVGTLEALPFRREGAHGLRAGHQGHEGRHLRRARGAAAARAARGSRRRCRSPCC